MTFKKGVAIAAIAALAVAACGGDDDESTDTTSAPETAAEAATTTAGGSGATTTRGSSGATTTASGSGATTTGASSGATTTAAAGGGGGGSGWTVDTEDCPETATQPIEGPIKIGVTLPLSGGPAVLYATLVNGMQAYVDYVNANGGIDGTQLELVAADDQFRPDLTVPAVEQMLDSDGIHLMSGNIGSGPNLAIRDLLNEECIPHLYINSGVQEWGDVENYPWSTGFLPNYNLEGAVYAAKIQEDFPDGAQVALFYVNNEFGQANAEGFKKAIEGTNIEIVDEQTIEASESGAPSSQVTSMAGSGANVLVSTPLGAQCIALKNEVANSGWEPELYTETLTCGNHQLFYDSVGAAADGVVTATYAKDVVNPQFADDDDVALYLAELAKNDPNVDPASIAGVGWMIMDGTADILRRAAASGSGLTQAAIIEAARSQDFKPALTVDGIEFVMDGAEDAYLFESLQLQRYSAADKLFVFEGGVTAFEGETEPFEG